MSFAGMNYLAIIVAAIAAFLFGGAYYGALSKSWMRAARMRSDDAKMSAGLFITTFIAELVMAWVLAGVIGHLGAGQVTLRNGVISAAFIWLGFFATALTINHRYQGFGWDLTVIDAIHYLGALLIMGAIIGWWGV